MSSENCTFDIEDYTCNKGLLLPIVNEYTWAIWVRALLYLVGLLYCFLGVAIIADIFMCAIEKITSKTRSIQVYKPGAENETDKIEVKVWNNTVANLTLMALGSSAPEILLSIIEIVGNKFKAGALGPSTIVGSAAFNLFVISAVCIMAITSPNKRRIHAIKVFAVTAFFSVFAYVWLLLILMVITPNIVDIWEAVFTLLFFPILVILAYIADKEYCCKKKVNNDGEQKVENDEEEQSVGFDNSKQEVRVARRGRFMPWKKKTYELGKSNGGKMDDTMEKMGQFIKDMRKVHTNLKDEELAKLAAKKITAEQPHSRAWYRINVTRRLSGSKKLDPQISEELQDIYEHPEDMTSPVDHSKAIVEFTATRSAIKEGDGRVKIAMHRRGKIDTRAVVKVETVDGTAEAETDYVPIKEIITFDKKKESKSIEIEIIDDDVWEPDEVFFVKMSLDPSSEQENVILGKKTIHEVTIINDDDPGTFQFSKPSLLFKESVGVALIPVIRQNGCDGMVSVKWQTVDMKSKEGKDFAGREGELVFEPGEMSKDIEIKISNDQEYEKEENFKVELLEVSEGAKIGTLDKTIVTIMNDDEFGGVMRRIVNMTNWYVDAYKVDHTSYRDQFRNAMNVNGGDVENASNMDYLMHFLTFGWKVIFAIVPPPSIWGGWLAFFVALGMIGLLTAVISDLASIFGCLVGLLDSVTAITFVALGTSLPDLFASKAAALNEKYADSSIGNVTGSNAVNVFLGLGLPWTIAAIYWTAQGKSFNVNSDSLGFSVTIFSVFAITTICVLLARRFIKSIGGELGGPVIPKYVSAAFLICLWFLYVLLSAFEAYDYIDVPF